MNATHFWYTDGGRRAAGFRGEARDCVTRAIAVVTGMSYRDAYALVNEAGKAERRSNRSHARTGVHKPTIRRIMAGLDFTWTPTMRVGGGCRVHLCADELPAGALVVSLSRHVTAMVDGVICDTHDPSRGGTRCVYGYWHRINRR